MRYWANRLRQGQSHLSLTFHREYPFVENLELKKERER